MAPPWATHQISVGRDLLAPDGSEIRLLVELASGSSVHCTLPPGGVTRAIRHRTVDELWLVLGGRGRVWRKRGADEEITCVQAGNALSLPAGTAFQFRTDGSDALTLVITTIPPWPGAHEAELMDGPWEAELATD